MSQEQLARGCQFGNHGEPFLWHGSSMDEVDIAIMQLINLANDNPKLAMEAADFVSACVKDAAEHSAHADAGKSADLQADSNADNKSTSQAESNPAPRW